MFSQTFANHTPIQPFIILSTTESTNNYAMAKLHAGLVTEGFCFIALHQSAGRGQRGNRWQSASGENITMSAVFEPQRHIPSNITAFPFVISAAIALGCYDFIKDSGITDLTIKWPNDLYIGDRKAAGILIENTMRGSSWVGLVAGVGINLNQTEFSQETGAPVSLSMVTGKRYDVVKSGRQLHAALVKRYEQLRRCSRDEIMAEYNSYLYKRDKEVRFRKNNAVFTAVIQQVSEVGELCIAAGSVEQRLTSGEIEFVRD